jgi:actin related protein 2/3 complex, subunit 1A/1B
VPAKPAALGGPGRLNTEAFNRFRQADSRGVGGAAAAGGAGGVKTGENGELLTVHQNTITELGAYEWGKGGEVTKFTTIGKDGRLCIWTV